jgi:eukaryotic-like serine/threonine-protein kinase
MADPRDPVDPGDERIVRDEWDDETMVVEQEEEVVAPRRRQPLLWPWLLLLLLLVLGGLGAYYYFSQDDDDDEPPAATSAATTETTAEEVRVPDVVGTTSSEATATLRDADLDANIVAVPSDRPAGTVLAQSPAAGSSVEPGTQVRLNVAEAPAATTQATTTTATTTQATTTETTATAPPPRPATVPDVVGAELADGARDFGEQGLKVAVRYVPSREAQGRIVAQARPAGTALKQGDTVQVNVSTGADPAQATAVPRVMGAEEERARTLLEDAGFEVLAIEFATADESKVGRVLSQSPGGGASVPQGSLVLLYIGAPAS